MPQDNLNNSYEEIWNEIKKHHSITICTHINADGDTIASALALKELILLNTSIKEIKISGEKFPRYLEFLPSPDEVSDTEFNNSLKIVVDTSNKHRVHDKRIVTKEAIKIDHHEHNEEWLLEVGGDHWPAVGEVLWELKEELNLKTNTKFDEYIFISIWTDTEKMTQRNISNQTRKIMNELNIDQAQIEKQMELTESELKIINDVDIKAIDNVSYLLTEKHIPNDIYRQFVSSIYEKSSTEMMIVGTKINNTYRVGLRSRGKIDISQFAKKMGGGGHYASAGFTLKADEKTQETIKKLIKEMNNEYKRKSA